MFFVVLSFRESLARITKVLDQTKCLSFNYEPGMVRLTRIDLNPVELKYYPFMISLDKCNGSFSILSRIICVAKETKYINVKAFNMVTNKNEAKAMTKHISCDCKYKCNRATCNSNQKQVNKTCQCECKKYHPFRKDYS